MSDPSGDHATKSPSIIIDHVATINLDEIETPESLLKEMSRCCICFETYNTGNHAPIAVPCGHTFCKTCVDTVIVDLVFCCCSCRTMSISNFGGFRKNLSLIQLLTHLNLLAKDDGQASVPVKKDYEYEYARMFDNIDVDHISRQSTFYLTLIRNYIKHYQSKGVATDVLQWAVECLLSSDMPIEMSFNAIRRMKYPRSTAFEMGGSLHTDSDNEAELDASISSNNTDDTDLPDLPDAPPSNEQAQDESVPVFQEIVPLIIRRSQTAPVFSDRSETVPLIDEEVQNEEVEVENGEVEGQEEEVENQIEGVEAQEEEVDGEDEEVDDENEEAVETGFFGYLKARVVDHLANQWHFYLFTFIVLYAHLIYYCYVLYMEQ